MKPIWIILLMCISALGLAGCTREQGPPASRSSKAAPQPGAEQSPGKDRPVDADIPPEAEQPPSKDVPIDIDIPPQPLNRVVPKYPDSARAKGIEGKVFVKALVGTDGKVKSIEVIKSNEGAPDFEQYFEQSALEAARAMSFAPARKDGKAVEVWVTIPFKFALMSSEGDRVLSELQNPRDVAYVEGYLEGLQATERQLQGILSDLRARTADTKEVEKSLQSLRLKIRSLQAHLARLKKEKPLK